MSMDHIVRRGSGSCRWGSIEMVGKSSIWRERERVLVGVKRTFLGYVLFFR